MMFFKHTWLESKLLKVILNWFYTGSENTQGRQSVYGISSACQQTPFEEDIIPSVHFSDNGNFRVTYLHDIGDITIVC